MIGIKAGLVKIPDLLLLVLIKLAADTEERNIYSKWFQTSLCQKIISATA